MKKSKIILVQGRIDPKSYTVQKLVNRVQPAIGTVLKRAEVEQLLCEKDLTVEITPAK